MPQGRAAVSNTPNRFERLHAERIDVDVKYEENPPPVRTTFLRDSTKSILARNDSPDLPFTFSLNPYRGCEHGCIYCYARPSHEFLGFSAGLDFESKITVKLDAPRLLDEALSAPSWNPTHIAFSGNTDCYQPVERTLRLTRQCLAVCLHHRNPAGIITKNHLITRDRDILKEMAGFQIVHVLVSIITLDPKLARAMEPRASTPEQRLQTIEQLASAGIPVGVNVAPVIPGLTDEEIPAILTEAARRGATTAGWTPVRLPGAVEALFVDWLQRELPSQAERICHRIREIHHGSLDESRFGHRMRGEGHIAAMIDDLFQLQAAKIGIVDAFPPLSTAHFRRTGMSGQMEMFDP